MLTSIVATATAIELFTNGFLLGISSYLTIKKGWYVMSKLLRLIKNIIIEMKITINTTDEEIEKASDIFGRRYNVDPKSILDAYKNKDNH